MLSEAIDKRDFAWCPLKAEESGPQTGALLTQLVPPAECAGSWILTVKSNLGKSAWSVWLRGIQPPKAPPGVSCPADQMDLMTPAVQHQANLFISLIHSVQKAHPENCL